MSAAPLTRAARRTAWLVALAADAVQWVLLPLLFVGAASPLDDVLDVVVAGVLWRLLGWHWALLPGFAAELVPGLELAPTWLLTVWAMTRGRPTAADRP
jgi:hypothetical protein